MEVTKYLQDFKKQFDPKLLEFLDQKEKQADKLSKDYPEAIKEIKRLIKAGGKRLRPAFVYTAFNAVGGKGNDVWEACLAVELIHVFALIHDDIMDNASLRRGQITCFKKLGLAKAILVGDVSLCLADELIPQMARKYFDLMKFELIGGQWLDILEPRTKNLKLRKKLKMDENEIMRIMELKTGMYTVARSLQVGVTLSVTKAPLSGELKYKKVIKAFYNYGKNLGIAFQIQDDILGVFGNEKEVGKPVGSDISEGKKTLLITRIVGAWRAKPACRGAVPAPFSRFEKIFGKRQKLTKKQLEFTRKIMVKYGALDYCQKKTIQLTEVAKKAIIDLEIRKREKEFLIGSCEYIIKRRY